MADSLSEIADKKIGNCEEGLVVCCPVFVDENFELVRNSHLFLAKKRGYPARGRFMAALCFVGLIRRSWSPYNQTYV